MANGKKIGAAFAATLCSRLVAICLSLAIYPILYDSLDPSELGVWLLINQAQAFAGMFDFGVVATLSRKIAIARGREDNRGNHEVKDWSKYTFELHQSGKWILAICGVATAAITFVVGLPFLLMLDSGIEPEVICFAFLGICLGIGVRTGMAIWEIQLMGAGRVGESMLLSSVNQSFLVACIATIGWAGGGLVELSAAVLVCAVLGRFAFRLLCQRLNVKVIGAVGFFIHVPLLKGLTGLSIRCWLTNIGTLLLFQTDSFFIAKVLGPSQLPDYRAAWQLLLNVQVLALTVMVSVSAFLSRQWGARQKDAAAELLTRCLKVVGLILAAGYATLFSMPEYVFSLWLGDGHFIGTASLAVLVLPLAIQGGLHSLMTATRSTDAEVYHVWAMTAAVLNLVLTALLIGPLGYTGVALATSIALLSTLGWFVPLHAVQHVGVTLREMAMMMMAAWGRFLLFLSIGQFVVYQLGTTIWTLATLSTIIGFVSLIDLWSFHLSSGERQHISRTVFSPHNAR